MIRLGNQEPTFSTVSNFIQSLGDKAIRYFESFKVRFYPCQKREMELFLALNEEKRFACRTICISKPRQNGKSYSARYYAIWKAVIEGKKVLYSAHHGKTTREMFKAMKDFIERNPSIEKKLLPGSDGIRKSAGLEGFFFANGGCIEFQTRTNSGGRGVTYDVIVIDEAQELTDEQLDAIKPTTIASESGDPQMIYLGTPPNVKCIGTVFRDFHHKVHAGDSEGIWWLEWAVDELPDMSDRMKVLDLAYMTNPAMGYRIKEDVMLDVIDTATAVDGFAREYLGWWSNTGSLLLAIPQYLWDKCQVERSEIPEPQTSVVCFAVKFAPDGSTGALAAAIRPDSGKPYVQLIAHRSMGGGVQWFADWLIPREDDAAVIVIDGRSYSGALVNELNNADFANDQIITPSSTDVATACSMLVSSVESRSVMHGGQDELTKSATNCRKRLIGNNGGYGFESANDTDATPIEACALAFWQAMTTTRDQRREGLVG